MVSYQCINRALSKIVCCILLRNKLGLYICVYVCTLYILLNFGTYFRIRYSRYFIQIGLNVDSTSLHTEMRQCTTSQAVNHRNALTYLTRSVACKQLRLQFIYYETIPSRKFVSHGWLCNINEVKPCAYCAL